MVTHTHEWKCFLSAIYYMIWIFSVTFQLHPIVNLNVYAEETQLVYLSDLSGTIYNLNIYSLGRHEPSSLSAMLDIVSESYYCMTLLYVQQMVKFLNISNFISIYQINIDIIFSFFLLVFLSYSNKKEDMWLTLKKNCFTAGLLSLFKTDMAEPSQLADV